MAHGGGMDFSAVDSATALLGQVTLDPKLDGSINSPVLTARPKFTRKYSLRELEIQQTIGEASSMVSRALCNRIISADEYST